MMKKINLGGKNSERLFLESLSFFTGGNTLIKFTPTELACDMPGLINRHKARYLLPTFLFKQKSKILDFPCGSGYASMLWKDFDIIYEGRDKDYYTIKYANNIYNRCGNNQFLADDLCNPKLKPKTYDVIVCVEGLEHIDKKSQKNLIMHFYNALKPKGTLYITTPEAHISGQNKKNKYHIWELTALDFITLLYSKFENIQLLEHQDIVHTGDLTNWLYAFCKKE